VTVILRDKFVTNNNSAHLSAHDKWPPYFTWEASVKELGNTNLNNLLANSYALSWYQYFNHIAMHFNTIA
jgi:hypothetical protein